MPSAVSECIHSGELKRAVLETLAEGVQNQKQLGYSS